MRDPRLDRLVGPRASGDFAERLGAFIRDRERARARRWRATAIVAAAAAVAAVASAGVFAFGAESAAGVVDRTITCEIPEMGGAPVFNLWANGYYPAYAQNGRANRETPAGVGVSTGFAALPRYLAYVSSSEPVYFSSACAPAARIPLARAGLPLLGVYLARKSFADSTDDRCLYFKRITIRIRARIGSNGRPTTATVAIRAGARLKPFLYAEFSKARVAVYRLDGYCRPRIP